MDQKDKDNRSNMLNPNNPAYWKCRGYTNRPEKWEDTTQSPMVPQQSEHDKNSYGVTKKDASCQYEPQCTNHEEKE